MFRDRLDAGRRLGARLHDDRAVSSRSAIVLGLARGGVPVAREVAAALGLPVDVLVVRKVGAPGAMEFAVAAVAEDGTTVVSDMADRVYSGNDALATAVAEQLKVARQRADICRAGRSLPALAGRDIIVVDDGLATGLTMECAVASVRAHGAAHIIVAVPTGSPEAIAHLATCADAVIACESPEDFVAVGEQYDHFPTVDDAHARIP